MSARIGGWREGLEDPFISEVVQFAREHNLDPSVSTAFMNPWDIQVEERVDPDYVKRLARSMKEAGEWPETMPLPVVMGGFPTIMDGSHRTTAARVVSLSQIPVLVVDPQAYFAIVDKFDIKMFDYVHSVLPAVDQLMAENERKDEEGGKLKRRIADSWDMDAFGGAISMGAAGPGSQAAAMALDLRNRILTLHESRRAMFPEGQWMSMNRCLVGKATPTGIAKIAMHLLPPTFTREAEQDAEAALIGRHGEEKYSNEILLRRHINDTLLNFRILLLMNEILRSCGYGPTRPEVLLEQAAGQRTP